MTLKKLILNKLRQKYKFSWKKLAETTGISASTLQDIAQRQSKYDISQIESGVKQKLEQIAIVWGIKYEQLFETVDESIKKIYAELDDVNTNIEYISKFIKLNQENGKTSNAAYNLLELLNQTPFIFKGDFNRLLAEFLKAEADELNTLSEDIVFNFISLCQDKDDKKTINSITRKLCDIDFNINIKVLCYFASAMHQCDFNESGEKLFNEASRIFSVLLNNSLSTAK